MQPEYLDALRITSIDPMYNLFLGTAKYVFKLSVKKNLLRKKESTWYFRAEDSLFGCHQTLHQTIVVTKHHGEKIGSWYIQFLVLLKRSASRKTPKLLSEICSCLQVDMFSNHVQDWHCLSWSAFWKIWPNV